MRNNDLDEKSEQDKKEEWDMYSDDLVLLQGEFSKFKEIFFPTGVYDLSDVFCHSSFDCVGEKTSVSVVSHFSLFLMVWY